jgi:subtilisin family serine protease
MRNFWVIRFIAYVILIGGVTSPSSLAQAWQAGAAEMLPPLAEKALAEGIVKVIARLDIGMEFIPEGYLSRREALLQRQAIQKAQGEMMDSLAGLNATFHALYTYVPYAALEVDAVALEVLRNLPLVLDVQEDKLSQATLASSTQLIGAPVVWDAGVTGSGWTVAVLDTGIQWDHPFFGGAGASRVVSEACYSTHLGDHELESLCQAGWDVDVQETGHAADATIARCDPGSANYCAHGSHVAGIAAGSGSSSNGVAPGANIIAIQVFTRFNDDSYCGGSGTAPCFMSYDSDQMLGLQRIYNLRGTYAIASVNMSLGGGLANPTYCDSNPLKPYIDTLLSVGITTAIASGNDGFTTGISAPACISTAVAVGATTDDDKVASFSNSSSIVDLLAPGVGIDSSVPVSAYDTYNGTSMATPHVAGAFALLKSYCPSATAGQILAALQNTGVNVTDARNGVVKPRIQVDASANASCPALTWVGNTTAWDLTSNWSTAQIPLGLHTVVIPTTPAGGHFPVLDTSANAYNLTIQPGANISMTAGALNIFHNFTVESGGAFTASGGTTIFQGTAGQAVSMPDSASNHFYHLQVGNGSTHPIVSPLSTLDVNGDLTILPGARLNPGSNTLRVAGNWADADGQFNPGASTVTFDGSGQSAQVDAAQTILLQEDFSAFDGLEYSYYSPDPPAGWLVENTSGGSYPWFFVGWAQNPNTVLNGHARHYKATSGTRTTWLFTPGLSLSVGVSYQLQYRYGVYSSERSLRVALGSSQASASMTTILHDFNAVNTTWYTDTVNFSVAADGTYYIGFRASTSIAGDGISVDDISVAGAPQLTFYNLNILSSGTGVILGDNATVKNNLVVNAGGHLDLGGYNLAVDGTLTNNGRLSQTKDTPGSATTSFLHITNASGAIPKYYGVDLTPAASMGATTVSILGNQPSCTSNPVDALLRRCFHIIPGSAQNATLRFWYTEAERNSQQANALLLWHGTNTLPLIWTQAGDGYTYSEGGAPCESGGGLACWMQAINVAEYSPFSPGSGGTPTAVRLRSLRAASPQGGLPLIALTAAAAAGGWIIWRRKK